LGVPRALKNTAFPFTYGKITELREVLDKHRGEIGVIVTEVTRQAQVDRDFLNEITKLARAENIVLVFDETSSGFRTRAGAQHVTHGLEPDIVVLGKAMGNGFPIAAIVGKKSVMEVAQDTFISSTFWSERVGFAAALEVIRQFEYYEAGDCIKTTGIF